MRRLGAVVLATALGPGGCVAYVGGANPIDPDRVAREPGWMGAATPEVSQSSPTDCGPAALSMVARHWQVTLPLEEAVEAVPEPSKRGVKLGDLRAAARERGLVAFAIQGDRETLIRELRAGRPVIVGLILPHRLGRVRSHYEVVIAVRPETDEFVTIDPAADWQVRTWDALDEEWRAAGRPSLVVLGWDAHAAVACGGARGSGD